MFEPSGEGGRAQEKRRIFFLLVIVYFSENTDTS